MDCLQNQIYIIKIGSICLCHSQHAIGDCCYFLAPCENRPPTTPARIPLGDTVWLLHISHGFQCPVGRRMRCAALLRVRLIPNTSDMLCVKFYLLSSHGMQRHIIYSLFVVTSVGHAFNEINRVWQQISRRDFVRRGRNLAHWYSGLAVSTSALRLVNFGSVVPLGTKIAKGVKKFL